MPKSKIDIDEFWSLWYSGDEIDIDAIEDPILKSMYIEYAAQEEDLADLYEKIVRYLDANAGNGREVYGEGDEGPNGQSNGSRYRLLDSGPH